ASNAEETVSGNPPYLKPSKTYTLEIAHHEQGDNILEYQLENGIQPITATYTVPKNPTVQTFNATLKAPVPYYFGYVDGNPQFIYLESGKTYTVSPEQSLSFLIKNRIKGATYTLTSSNPAAVQTSGLSYTAVAAGEAALTLTVAYGNASETFRFTVKVSRTQVAVPAADPTVYTYDGTEQTYQLPANSAYTVSNAPRTEAGSQQVTVALKDTARTEWADGTTADKYYEFTIQKAKTVAKHPAGLTLNYNGAPQPLVAGGETVNGLSFRFEYALGADSTTAPAAGWSTDLPTAVDAGDYYVWYRLIADSNHESLAPACTVAKILPVSPTADLFYFTPPQALTYDGTPKLADVTPAPSVRGMGSVTVRYYEENGQPVESPVDAGNYRVELELESGTNYTAATLQNANWSFTVKPRTLEIQWGETAFVYDGSEHFPDFLVHNVIDTDDIILETSGKAINASDTPYTAKIIGISGADSANYSLPANCEIDFTVARIVPDVGTVTVAEAVTDRTLPAQVQLTHSGTALGTLTLLNPAVSPSKSDYRWQFTPADTTNYETVYGDILLDVLDTRPPALTLHAAEQDWTQIQEKFTFDRLLNTPQTVTLTAADEADGSGLKAVEYLITDQPLDLEARSAAQWQPYTEAIRLTADGRYIVYARAIDNDGNLTLASTDGLVIDTVAPLFQGIADGETYVGDRQFKVVDQGAVRLTVDGADVTDQLADGEFTLPADDQQHLLIATDEAGNSTECRITVNRQKQNQSAGGNGGS
ncbi:MAG: hypothetical protein IJN82_04850, partial [Clostridia bacterium]|nr:hypothetical protein [Clostridia bacterium]